MQTEAPNAEPKDENIGLCYRRYSAAREHKWRIGSNFGEIAKRVGCTITDLEVAFEWWQQAIIHYNTFRLWTKNRSDVELKEKAHHFFTERQLYVVLRVLNEFQKDTILAGLKLGMLGPKGSCWDVSHYYLRERLYIVISNLRNVLKKQDGWQYPTKTDRTEFDLRKVPVTELYERPQAIRSRI